MYRKIIQCNLKSKAEKKKLIYENERNKSYSFLNMDLELKTFQFYSLFESEYDDSKMRYNLYYKLRREKNEKL